MLIVYWPIEIKLRTREQTQKHILITVSVCGFVLMRLRVCLNVAGRDSRVEVAGAGAGAGKHKSPNLTLNYQ